MPIWEYEADPADRTPLLGVATRYVTQCPYCESHCSELATDPPNSSPDLGSRRVLQVCACCGWWVVSDERIKSEGYAGQISVQRRWAILRQFDDIEINLPIQELSHYLVAKFVDRNRIHPRRLEEVVAGVFADWGYRVRVTSYSGDDGIDAIVVLDGNNSDTVGVQVKRYAGRIKAEQIRAFAGSLVLNGMTMGVFVTTSEFQPGATETAKRFAARGIGIRLWDASLLYQALKLNARQPYVDANDVSAPFYGAWCGNRDLWPAFSDSWDYGAIRNWH